MKVLHVAASYSIDYGGPPKSVLVLCEALAKKGVKSDILTTCLENENFYPAPKKANLVKIKRSKFFSRVWNGFSPNLVQFLQKNIEKYDVVHVHELWHFPGFAAFLLAKKIPCIVTVRGCTSDLALKSKFFRKKMYSAFFQKKALANASRIIALTLDEKREIEKYLGKKSKNITVIPNGLNFAEFKKLPKKDSFKKKHPELKNKKYVLFLGRISEGKGARLLVLAFKKLAIEHPDLCVVFAGPSEKKFVEKVKNELGEAKLLKRAVFTGLISGGEKLAAFSGAELFALPSYHEGFSMAALEAMACKIPVIISRTGCYKELEKNKAGIVVETNPESICAGIKKLLDNPDFRKKIAKSGKTFVEKHCNIEKISGKILQEYEKIAEKNG